MNYPHTIKHKKTFDRSQCKIECPYCNRIFPYDGYFYWDWVTNAIHKANPQSRITPMDFDGVVERFFHYLIFETKEAFMYDENNKSCIVIPQGQLWTLERLSIAKSFTIMKVWGKKDLEWWEAEIRFPGQAKPQKTWDGHGMESASNFVYNWYLKMAKQQ